MGRAVIAFLTHAAEEEEDQLPKLTQKLSEEENHVNPFIPISLTSL